MHVPNQKNFIIKVIEHLPPIYSMVAKVDFMMKHDKKLLKLWRQFSQFKGFYPTHVWRAVTSLIIDIFSYMIHHVIALTMLFPMVPILF